LLHNLKNHPALAIFQQSFPSKNSKKKNKILGGERRIAEFMEFSQ